MIVRLTALIIGYLFGNVQTAYIYGKTQGIDIRKTGSGNAGTTNALRTLGPKAGAIVMAGDILKCVIAIALVRGLFAGRMPELDYLLRMYTAAGCILGHNYPFYMNFKGGKGVACTGGMIISLSLPMTLIGIVIFFGTVVLTHYVSLASLLIGVELLVGMLVMGMRGLFHTSSAITREIWVLTLLIVAEMYWRHRKNIRGLLSGTERKTYIFKKK